MIAHFMYWHYLSVASKNRPERRVNNGAIANTLLARGGERFGFRENPSRFSLNNFRTVPVMDAELSCVLFMHQFYTFCENGSF